MNTCWQTVLALGLCLVMQAPGQTRTWNAADPVSQRLTYVSESTYTAYLKGLEAFGTRHAGQSNRDTVSAWIAQRFRDAGLASVAFDSFSASGVTQRNVVATMTGSDPSPGEIVVGAHYDSQSSIPALAPGADDNASGTAAILEMARALVASGYQPVRTLRFVAFGAEELGLLGSEWYASQIVVEHPSRVLMLNFDMIGTRRRDTTDRDMYVVYYDHAISEAGRAVSAALTYTTLTPITTTQHRPHSDSWPFATRGYPCVFYIEADFSERYHSPHDSSTYLDMTYAADVTKAGLAMLLLSDTPPATTVDPRATPVEWELAQNYPNPFNGVTVVRYRVGGGGDQVSGVGDQVWGVGNRGAGTGYQGAENGAGRSAVGAWVNVSVHDLLGREIAVLAEGELPGGDREVRWNASAFPSGVYVVKLAAVDASGRQTLSTRRMVLMK